MFSNQPIVIDNGSGVLKAGFAGAAHPQTSFATAVGRPKHRHSNIRIYGGKVRQHWFSLSTLQCHIEFTF